MKRTTGAEPTAWVIAVRMLSVMCRCWGRVRGEWGIWRGRGLEREGMEERGRA